MAMKIRLRALALAAGAIALGFAGPNPARAEDDPLVTFRVLSPESALVAAQAALDYCRAEGYQVSVVVVDRFGIEQVLLRDRFAGPHTPSTARRKAWTAVSFRTDTLSLSELAETDKTFSGLRHVDGALLLGGGVPISAAGSIVGGIGISGAPSGQVDDTCARAGAEEIETEIAF